MNHNNTHKAVNINNTNLNKSLLSFQLLIYRIIIKTINYFNLRLTLDFIGLTSN